jgi:hypothetical protein
MLAHKMRCRFCSFFFLDGRGVADADARVMSLSLSSNSLPGWRGSLHSFQDMETVLCGHSDVVAVLVQAGADLEALNRDVSEPACLPASMSACLRVCLTTARARLDYTRKLRFDFCVRVKLPRSAGPTSLTLARRIASSAFALSFSRSRIRPLSIHLLLLFRRLSISLACGRPRGPFEDGSGCSFDGLQARTGRRCGRHPCRFQGRRRGF